MNDNPFATTEVEEPWAVPTSANRGMLWVLFSFRGRLGRREAWIGWFLASVVVVVYFTACVLLVDAMGWSDSGGLLLLPGLVVFGWASLAMRVKRWHDLGYSGFAVFIHLVPYLGGLIAFVMTGVFPGEEGPNRFGPPPDSQD